MASTSGGKVLRGYKILQEHDQKSYGSNKAGMGQLKFDQNEVTELGDDHALALGRWSVAGASSKSATVGGVFSLILRRSPSTPPSRK